MANYGIVSYPAPVMIGAVASAGGSLAPNTTYYYKVVLGFHHGGARGFSPYSTTVSATTTDVNKTITVSWNAVPGFTQNTSRDGYTVLRNTVDDFTDDQQLVDSSVGQYIKVLSLVDTGSVTFKYSRFCSFATGLPIIWMNGGTSGSPILMYDIYSTDVSNGWGRVKPALDLTVIEYGIGKKSTGSWYSHASFAIGYDVNEGAVTTYFDHSGGSIIIYGNMASSASVTMTLGRKVNTYNHTAWRRVLIAFHGPWYFNTTLNGVHKWYGVYMLAGGYTWESTYDFIGWSQSYITPNLTPSAGSEFYECDFSNGGNSIIISGTADIRNCRFSDLAAISTTLTIVKPSMAEGYVLNLWYQGPSSNITITEPTTWRSNHDITWDTKNNRTLVDGAYKSHSQVDNRPWLFLGYNAGGMLLTGSLTFQYTFTLQVVNSVGSVLSDVSVLVKDSTGATVATGTTDVNGQYTPGVLTSYILIPLISKTGYEGYSPKAEATMVSDGTLRRDLYTPHTITLSKTGYITKTLIYNMDRKREEVEQLELSVPVIYPLDGSIYKNLKPTSSANKFLWDRIG